MIRIVTGKETIVSLKAMARAGAKYFDCQSSGRMYEVRSITPFQLKEVLYVMH